MNKKIYISADHGGFYLKEHIKKYLEKNKYEIIDKGCYDSSSVNYPDFAYKLVKVIKNDIGILFCGTGIGMSIACNRHKHIRCALCYNNIAAEYTRKHNNSNVIALGSKFVDLSTSIEIINIFLSTKFEEGRHLKRINKL